MDGLKNKMIMYCYKTKIHVKKYFTSNKFYNMLSNRLTNLITLKLVSIFFFVVSIFLKIKLFYFVLFYFA